MTEINYDVEPDETNALVLISAESWCVPCRQFAPSFKKAADDYNGDVSFYKIDLDDNLDIAKKYNVMSVPTVLRIVNGEVTPVTERRPVKFLDYVNTL